MLKRRIREVLLHELHAGRGSVDQVASYLLAIASHDDGGTQTLPCPRCYTRDAINPLVMSIVNGEMREAACESCGSHFDFRVQVC